MEKIWWGKIRIVSYSPKFSSPLYIHRHTENILNFGICTDCSIFAKFFLTNSFYLYGSPNFPPPKLSRVRYTVTRVYILYIGIMMTWLMKEQQPFEFNPIPLHCLQWLPSCYRRKCCQTPHHLQNHWCCLSSCQIHHY